MAECGFACIAFAALGYTGSCASEPEADPESVESALFKSRPEEVVQEYLDAIAECATDRRALLKLYGQFFYDGSDEAELLSELVMREATTGRMLLRDARARFGGVEPEDLGVPVVTDAALGRAREACARARYHHHPEGRGVVVEMEPVDWGPAGAALRYHLLDRKLALTRLPRGTLRIHQSITLRKPRLSNPVTDDQGEAARRLLAWRRVAVVQGELAAGRVKDLADLKGRLVEAFAS